MNFITKSWKGILLCLVIAVPCWFLGQTFPIIGGPVFGILAGMIITLLLKDKSMFQDGITFVSKKVLQYAVILLGFGLNLSVILETGKQSLPIIVTTISTALIIAYLSYACTGKYFHTGRCRIFHLRRLCNCRNSTGH